MAHLLEPDYFLSTYTSGLRDDVAVVHSKLILCLQIRSMNGPFLPHESYTEIWNTIENTLLCILKPVIYIIS